MAFGNFVREQRNGRGLSLREVAARIGVNPSYLSRVEAGKVRPSEHLVEQLAPVLDCSADDLALLAGQLPSSVRSALEREDLAPAEAVRELATLYVAEPRSDYQAGTERSADATLARATGGTMGAERLPSRNLSLFPDEVQPGRTPNKHESGHSVSSTEAIERRVDPRNHLNALTSTEWIPETVSVWTQRGLGAGHEDAKIERQHPAPFSFTDVARLIRFFSKPGELVLDPFLGVGSTLKACALEGRRGVGIELNPRYADLARERLRKEVRGISEYREAQRILQGDSRELVDTLESDSVDFVVTSPPYWNILHKEDHKARQERKDHDLDTRYSDDPRDLGNVKDYNAFLEELSAIFGACGRALKRKKYMAVVVSDFRDKSRFMMFHADLAHALEARKFGLRGPKVLYQRHKKIFPYGYPYAYVPNIHHQYILILQNAK